MKVYDFKGFANVRLNHLKEAQQDMSRPLQAAIQSRGCGQDHPHAVPSDRAGNQQYSKA